MITEIFRQGDNYAYVIACPEKREAALVDPVAVAPILAWVRDMKLKVVAIFNTHSHPDHTSGNSEVARETGCEVISHELEQVPGRTRSVEDGDKVQVGNIAIKVIHTPGHTPGGICLKAEKGIFTGDTLFLAGCGNCRFGGNVEQMAETFLKKLTALEDNLIIYPGHDYGATNLAFAETLEPKNQDLLNKKNEVLEQSGPDVEPLSTVKEERKYNPFFRASQPSLIKGVSSKVELKNPNNPREVFKALRELRNHW